MSAAVLVVACASAVQGDVEREVEEAVGRVMAEALIAQRGRLDQPVIDRLVTGVAERLVEHSPRRDLHYRFIVLDSPESNGFALPGGWVFVTAGLLENMRSEDELAAVIGHELAHLADRDFQRHVKRAALFLGIAELLRRNDAGDWVPLVHAVQLVNTLRHSRRQEAQADHVGCGIAWRAGYDPTALVGFLGSAPGWSYLETVFATHPHPDRRRAWIRERVAELREDDPEGALAVARSLVERGRPQPATRLLAEPLEGDHEEARAGLLARVEAARPASAAGDARLTEEALTDVREDAALASEAKKRAGEERERAWRRLKHVWADAEIERALVLAQAVDPELGDPGYLALLAQTIHLMHRSVRGANLVARVLRARDANLLALSELARELTGARVTDAELRTLVEVADGVGGVSAELVEASEADVKALCALAGDYHEAARLVAAVLTELALAGEGDPLGRLVFSRFLALQAQVRALRERLDRIDDRLESLAAKHWRVGVALSRMRLDVLGAGVAPPDRRGLVEQLGRTLAGGDELARRWHDRGTLGDATLAAIRDRTRSDTAPFGGDLRAEAIMMRLKLLEAKERMAWRTKNGVNGKEAQNPCATRCCQTSTATSSP